jgi:hypothetical protein
MGYGWLWSGPDVIDLSAGLVPPDPYYKPENTDYARPDFALISMRLVVATAICAAGMLLAGINWKTVAGGPPDPVPDSSARGQVSAIRAEPTFSAENKPAPPAAEPNLPGTGAMSSKLEPTKSREKPWPKLSPEDKKVVLREFKRIHVNKP